MVRRMAIATDSQIKPWAGLSFSSFEYSQGLLTNKSEGVRLPMFVIGAMIAKKNEGIACSYGRG